MINQETNPCAVTSIIDNDCVVLSQRRNEIEAELISRHNFHTFSYVFDWFCVTLRQTKYDEFVCVVYIAPYASLTESQTMASNNCNFFIVVVVSFCFLSINIKWYQNKINANNSFGWKKVICSANSIDCLFVCQRGVIAQHKSWLNLCEEWKLYEHIAARNNSTLLTYQNDRIKEAHGELKE